jgi:hypothetical protein
MRLNTLFSLFLPTKTPHRCASRVSGQLAVRGSKREQPARQPPCAECAVTPLAEPRLRIRCGAGYRLPATFFQALRVINV